MKLLLFLISFPVFALMPLEKVEKTLEKELEGESDKAKYQRYQKLANFYLDDEKYDRAIHFYRKSTKFKTRYNYAQVFFKIFDIKLKLGKSLSKDIKELEEYLKNNPKFKNHSVNLKTHYYKVISSKRPSYEIIPKRERALFKHYTLYNRELSIHDLNYTLKNGYFKKAKEVYENDAKIIKDPVFILYGDLVYKRKGKDLSCLKEKRKDTEFNNICKFLEDRKNKSLLLNTYSKRYEPLVSLLKNHLYK